MLNVLTLPVTIPYEEKKINYFRFSLRCLKRFYERLKALHKTFKGTTKKCKNKDLIFILIQLLEMLGTGRVQAENWSCLPVESTKKTRHIVQVQPIPHSYMWRVVSLKLHNTPCHTPSAALEIEVLSTSATKCRGNFQTFHFALAIRRQKNCRRLDKNLCILRDNGFGIPRHFAKGPLETWLGTTCFT